MTDVTVSLWNDDDCRRAHEATLAILEVPGVEVRNQRARDLLAAAGAGVDGTRVRISTELVAQARWRAHPRRFSRQVARRGTSRSVVAQGSTYFGTGGDCLYTHDLESGKRRRSRQEDIREIATLANACPTSTSSCPWPWAKTHLKRVSQRLSSRSS